MKTKIHQLNLLKKTGTSFIKADLTELINKIGDRDLKLIELIKNNPVSKFKTTLYQKTKTSSSEYYFETDNIMAIKNETNQAVYIIPAYKSSNSRDNNIYSISINITDDFIDTKLNILQLKDNGTQESISYDFVYSTSASKTSKVKDIDCYCTVTVSDCTCHTTHAPSGCDHPIVSYTECSCSGGASFGTATGSNAGATIISNIWASSGGGTNYGYTYNYTGQQAYIGLTKKFSFNFFTSFQQVAITTNPEISNILLEFLDTDGNSQMNKDFVVSIIDAIEEGSVTNYEQSLVLLNAYKTVKVALQIENQIDDTLLNPCSKGVFQQVKNTTNCDFASVLVKLNSKASVYNTKIISQVPPTGYAPAQTIKNSPFNYTIYISTDYTTKTKLFIATSLLHEMVHTYFMSIYDDYYNGNPPNPNAYNDFSYLFDFYVKKKYPTSTDPADIHHQQLATDYTDAIARALQEYQTGTPVPNNVPPDQIYSDLAYGSLKDTPAVFDALFPLGNPNRQRILNRYACEQVGSTIGAGTPAEQNPIGQPCN